MPLAENSYYLAYKIGTVNEKLDILWRVYNLSGLVAHNLSGLRSPLEVTHETDRSTTGDTEDEI
jgi:hypothetical protein